MMTETVVTVENAPKNNAAKPNDTRSGSWLKINAHYFLTQPGIIKLVELVLGILCMALASPAYLAGTHWFLFAATISFIGTLIWSIVYFLGIREALSLPIDWLVSELVNTAVFAVFYFIGFLVQIIIWVAHTEMRFRGVNITAGVFGLFNTVVYAYGTMLLHREWKSTRTN